MYYFLAPVGSLDTIFVLMLEREENQRHPEKNLQSTEVDRD